MDVTEVLHRLSALGITARASGEKLLLEPGSKVPPALLREVRAHKDEILSHLRHPMVGGGNLPPLDRPPETEQELRRLIDHLADPELFTRWLEWAMNRVDPAEKAITGNGEIQHGL